MNPKLQLFIISFLTLFLELALIRFIPSQVRLVGYFTNIILLASFLGIGLGFLFYRSKSTSTWLRFFPFPLTLLLSLILLYPGVDVTSPEIIFFHAWLPGTSNLIIAPEIILPLVFFATTIAFIPLSHHLAHLFSKFPPLTAYSLDIAGAIVGIISFSLFSAVSAPPFWWFTTLVVGYLLIKPPLTRLLKLTTFISLVIIIALPTFTNGKSIWSPYYKITTYRSGPFINVAVNNVAHQYITNYKLREKYYFSPYLFIQNPHYRHILIIGAGTGIDTAVALGEHPQVESIDAVDIDPKLLDLGRKLNPDRPYQDARVTTHVADGRNFLEKTQRRYDLIIFALPDSLILTQRSGHVRLESFLFTRQAFQLAKDHLSPQGLLVLYNSYREDWLIDKIATTLTNVFGESPYILTSNDTYKSAIFLSGPKTKDINPTIHRHQGNYLFPIAQDNWPFLYLKQPQIPSLYLRPLAIILGLTLIIILFTRSTTAFNFRFFFLGVGFMLLETRHLITFSLLFGTTWVVNSLVFVAILTSVLLANVIISRHHFRSLHLYLALAAILTANIFLPPQLFLKLPLLPRYLVSSLFYFSPIFIANLIFSQAFQRTAKITTSFGANLVGAVFGGLLEYTALVTGYQNLLVLVLIAYSLALLPTKKI